MSGSAGSIGSGGADASRGGVSASSGAFKGQLLVTNNEMCKTTAGFSGMNLYDVSKPSAPTPLAVGVGDSTVGGNQKKTANQIHSVFAWDAGARAYARMFAASLA